MMSDAAIAAAQAPQVAANSVATASSPPTASRPGQYSGGVFSDQAGRAGRHRGEIEVIGRRPHGAADDFAVLFDGGEEDRLVKRMIGAGERMREAEDQIVRGLVRGQPGPASL